MEPPTKRTIEVHAGWPPISIGEAQEARTDHLTMAIVSAIAAAATLLTTMPDPAVGLFTFALGISLERWLAYPQLYGGDEQ